MDHPIMILERHNKTKLVPVSFSYFLELLWPFKLEKERSKRLKRKKKFKLVESKFQYVGDMVTRNISVFCL